MSEREAIKIVPGSDLHLNALGAPMHWNLLAGKDKQEMLQFGRAVWQASRQQALEDFGLTEKEAKDDQS